MIYKNILEFDNRPFSYGANRYYETDYTKLTYFTTNYIYWLKGQDCPCDYTEIFYYKTAFTFHIDIASASHYVDLKINDSLCTKPPTLKADSSNYLIGCTLYNLGGGVTLDDTSGVKVYCNNKNANLILNCSITAISEMRDLEVHISSKLFDPHPDCPDYYPS